MGPKHRAALLRAAAWTTRSRGIDNFGALPAMFLASSTHQI